MYNKLNFRNKKVIALSTLASFCITTPLICSGDEVSASMLARAGSSASRSLGSSLGRISVGRASTTSLRRASTTSGLNSNNRLSTGSLSALNQRLTNLETQRNLEVQKNNHKFNKAIIVSGLISSAAMVAGVVGGVIQQAKFIEFSSEQAKIDQTVQEDLTDKRYHFQEVEVPEAEQYIIDYYKENFGIDITKQ